MAKNIQVNLGFTADTEKAKSQLRDLQNSLTKLTTNSTVSGGLGITEDIQKAIIATTELKAHLQEATNVKTGTLDFSKLNNSLKQSGTSLSQYATQLKSLGPDGQAAFIKLSAAIAQSEVPLRRANALLSNFAITMKNTVKWQISSSLMHGFTGALQSAYSYAQKLDKSLNDIRIVTGQSTEQMAKFAEQANKAAQNLSTTTTAYSNAALIFYQQGLDDKAVKERTDTVIKLSNVTGDSAEDVSSYMTAIWENFDNGSKSLEYYADVITRLGADTAASSAEIAEGISSFASIGQTIGLSYEYATSALTTIVAKTRASASEVGNGLRTIFSRLQNLSLGETLDDGTDLTKYSKALATVGVNIKDASGELKSMDDILDDLASKWNTLDQAEKVALANTVGGVRQYTKLISLMDNWDFMKQNITSATNSSGSLQEQADIYAESWEAAQKRVKAAAQKIYKQLFDKDFFTNALNAMEKILDFVNDIVESLGGFSGILTTVGALLTKTFGGQIANSLKEFAYNVKMSTDAGRYAATQARQQELNNLTHMMGEGSNSNIGVQAEQMRVQLSMQQKLEQNQDRMGEREIKQAQEILDIRKQIGEQIIKADQAERDAKEKRSSASSNLFAKFLTSDNNLENKDFFAQTKAIKTYEEALFDVTNLSEQYANISKMLGQAQAEQADAQEELNQAEQANNEDAKVIARQHLTDATQAVSKATEDLGTKETELRNALSQAGASEDDQAGYLNELTGDTTQYEAALEQMSGTISSKSVTAQKTLQQATGATDAEIREYTGSVRQVIRATREKTDAQNRATEADKAYETQMKASKAIMQDWAKGIVAGAQGIMSVISIIDMCASAIDKLSDPDATGWEKFSAILRAAALVILMSGNAINGLTTMVKNLSPAVIKNTVVTGINTIAAWLNKKAKDAVAKTTTQETINIKANTSETNKNTGAKIANSAASKVAKKGTKSFGGALKNLGSSLGSVIKANASYIAGVGLIAAGIAVAVAAIAISINIYNQQANAAKRAQEAANEAAESYQKVKEAYDTFTSNLSSYEDAVSGLESLTKGTDEYKNKLLEANSAAMELMNTYNGLTYTMKDGLISIDQASLDTAKEAQMLQVQNAQQASLTASQNAKNKQLESDMTDFKRKQLKSNGDIGVGIGNTLAATGAGAGSGALIGLGLGSIIPGIGNAVGAAVGAIVGAVAGLVTGIVGSVQAGSQTNYEQNILDNLLDKYQENGDEIFASEEALRKTLQEMGITDQNAIDSLTDNISATRDLIISMNEVEASNRQLYQALVDENFSDKLDSYNLDDADKSQVENIMSAHAEQLAQDYYDNVFADSASGGKATYNGKEYTGKITDADVQKLYAEAMGWNVNHIDNQNGNKATYYDDKGNVVADSLDDAVARQYLAQQAALQTMGQDIDSYVETFKKTVELGNSISAGLGNTLGTFNGGSDGQYKKMTSQQAADLKNNLGEYDANSNTFKLGNQEITEKMADDLGYESVEAYYNALSKAINNFESDFENLSKDWLQPVKDALDPEKGGIDISSWTLDEQEILGKALNQAFANSGSLEAFQNIFDKIPTNQLDEFANGIEGINWNSTSVKDLSAALEEAGVDASKLGNEDLQALIDAMVLASDATAELISKYQLLHETIDGISDGGSISADKYKELDAIYQQYFQLQLDGSYKLIGSAKELQSLLKENQISDYKKQENNLASSNSELQTIRTYNFDDLSKVQEDSNANVEKQLKIIDALNQGDEEIALKVAKWEEDLRSGTITANALAEIATEVTNCKDQFDNIDDTINANVNQMWELDMAIASSYDNLHDLRQAYEDDKISLDAFNTAAKQLDDTLDTQDLNTEELQDYADYLQEASSSMEGFNDSMDDNEAKIVAKSIMKMNDAVETLAENFVDAGDDGDYWIDILKNSSKESEEYANAMNGTIDAVANLLDISSDYVSQDFISSHLDEINQAATGDAEAIDALKSALADDIIANILVNNGFEVGSDPYNTLMESYNSLKANLPDIEVGATLETGDFINGLNALIEKTGMSVDQVNALCDSLGFEANYETQEVPTSYTIPVTTTVHSRKISKYDQYNNPTDWVDTESVTTSYESAEGEYAAFAITTSSGATNKSAATTPKISGVTRKPSGSANNYSSSNAGGKTSGGGSGGGSSKSTEHNDEDYKDYTDEKERYHVIKNQLEDLTSQYDRISSAKDKAFGSARLANLNKEIAAQKKLTQANKQYLDEIESYLAQDKGTMAAYGAIFDENGTILNYDELVKSQVDAYNSAVDTYNAAYTDDEGAKAAFEAAQERYDDFQDALDQYEETQDLFNEQTQTYIDSLNAERELLLERTQLQVELKVNVEEDALNFLEYALDNIENKAYDCAEAFGYLNDMTAAYLGTAKAYEEGLRSLFANQGLSDADFDSFINGNSATFNTISDMLSNGESAGFQSEDVETIREYVQELISANENLQEVRQTVHDQILTVWDEWNEKLDDGISKLEHLQAIQESYVNIIDIVGQKNLGVSNAFMRKLAQQGIDQANDKLIAEKARYDALKQARDDAYATFEEQKNKGILSEEELKIWEDSLRQMDEDVQSASEDFQSAWEDALTSIGEAFEAEVDRIIETYDDAAAGLMSSVSQLQEAFDRKSDLADQYLDDYEKIYQFSKLNRDIENSIDSTDNVKAKKELLELQSKINAYEEAGTDISEYELQQLQKEYELKKAQIELEESQEAKSQVKMQRDSEGNYSYVYTANDEDVSKAEQNYEDKLHDLQQLNAEYINDLQSNMIQMEQDYQDKVQEIMTDTSLTAEERMAQLNDLNEYYDEKMKFYISEAQLWAQNSQTLYEQDWTNYAAATGYKISAEDEWLDHWNETQLALLTGFDNLEDYQTNHNMNVANLLLASGEAFSTWQTNIEEAMNNAGTSIGTFEEDATENLNSVAEESETTKDQIVTDSEDMVNAVEDVMDAVARWEDDYSQTVQNMINKNKLLVQSFNSLIAAWSEYKISAAANDSDSSSSSSGSGSGSGFGNDSGSGSGSGFGSGSDNSDKVEGVAAAIWMDGSSTSGWGTGATRRQRLQEKGVSDAQAYINAHASNGDIYSAWASRRDQLKKYYYGSFDTGGYTGEWGVDGKLALLHEKELVLNADDTANFLQAIDVVRQISDMIDLNALSSAGGLSSLFAATTSGSDQSLQQEVHITAEFPNATDKNQITEAFNDIINLASQYANRK